MSIQLSFALQRKKVILNLIRNKRLLSYPPKYLFMHYITMTGIRILNPRASHVHYPGQALYYFF